MPDTAEYLARIREYSQNQDPLLSQSKTAAVLSELIAGQSFERLTRRPAQR